MTNIKSAACSGNPSNFWHNSKLMNLCGEDWADCALRIKAHLTGIFAAWSDYPFLARNSWNTGDILMSCSHLYIPDWAEAGKKKKKKKRRAVGQQTSQWDTYHHHLVQVSPACLRINRRPERGEKKGHRFAVKNESKILPTTHGSARQNFAVNWERAAGWSDFSPAAPADSDHSECGAQNTKPKKKKNTKQRPIT